MCSAKMTAAITHEYACFCVCEKFFLLACRLSDVDLPVQTPLPKSLNRQDSEVEQSGTQQHLMHFHPVLMEKMRLESPDTKQLHTLTHENHPFALLPEVCSRDVLHAESAVSVMSSPRNSTDPNTAQSAGELQ